jgi:hypothetical protein
LNGQLVIDAGVEQIYDTGEIEWLIN